MRVVTQANIIEFNRLYKKLKTYAAVSRATGFTPATVKKYIIDGFQEVDEDKIIRFSGELPDFDSTMFRTKDWGSLCELSKQETQDIIQLWKELEI
jgi:hypothetical protein